MKNVIFRNSIQKSLIWCFESPKGNALDTIDRASLFKKLDLTFRDNSSKNNLICLQNEKLF